MQPLISIVIPCYNQAQYLPETIQSVLAQTYQNWEAIIVNDGSPDNTEQIAKELVKKDKRIRYVYKENGGPSSTRNIGIQSAHGEFILPLDADDMIAPGYVELAVKAFCEDSKLKVVYCQCRFCGLKQGVWKQLAYKGYRELLLENSIFCSALFRKSDWQEVGGYDEKMRDGVEDWEFFIRLLQDNGKVYQIPQPLFLYRIKNVSMTTHAAEKYSDNKFYIYSKNRSIYDKYFNAYDILNEWNDLRKWRERYKNKWYRRCFRAIKDFIS